MYRFNQCVCLRKSLLLCSALRNCSKVFSSTSAALSSSSPEQQKQEKEHKKNEKREAKTKKINDAFKEVQQVWNVNFAHNPATTDVLNFTRNKHTVPLFHILELDGSICASNPDLKPEITQDTFKCRVKANLSGIGTDSATAEPTKLQTDINNSHVQKEGNVNKESHSQPLKKELSLQEEKEELEEEEFVLTRATAEHMLTTMLTHNTVDKILLEAQRQGRISFYMTMFGEEAAVIGVAAGLESYDEVFLQYRESGILTYRGFTIPQFIAQCMGNIEDGMKGRQMPIHYGCKELHVQMISSPLGTQIPHSAGAGYAIRLENEALKAQTPSSSSVASSNLNTHESVINETNIPNNNNNNNNNNDEYSNTYDDNIKVHHHLNPRIVACVFGDGAASEGDFHAGLNAAIVSRSHVLFVARNNGYAISTPTHHQYASDGIAGRAIAYGIPALRVDGTDALAVCHATRQARKLILSQSLPLFIEAFTYRISHHSTSDDSTAYRGKDEMMHFAEMFNPITRFENFMINCNWWNASKSEEIVGKTRKLVFAELRRQERLPMWPVSSMCDDVFEKRTWALEKQKNELEEHYLAHKGQYDKEKL